MEISDSRRTLQRKPRRGGPLAGKIRTTFLGKHLNMDLFEILKKYRLIDVLEFFWTRSRNLVVLGLKGGTAINFGSFFDFPRLSVDIDLDYLVNESKEKMLEQV